MSFLSRVVLPGVLCAAAVSAQGVGVPGQGTWETTLQPRELDGNAANGPEAFYDTMLDITWLRNADVNGLMNWGTAMTWADTLVVGGVGGWRLPTVSPPNGGTFFNYTFSNNGSTDHGYAKTGVGWGTSSELGHLYYVTLGNKGYCTPNDGSPYFSCVEQSGWGLTNTGGFQNLQSEGSYWYGTQPARNPGDAWIFNARDGVQGGETFKYWTLYAMAVRPGDVAVVPEPQAWAMLLLGLGAGAVARRRQRQPTLKASFTRT